MKCKHKEFYDSGEWAGYKCVHPDNPTDTCYVVSLCHNNDRCPLVVKKANDTPNLLKDRPFNIRFI